MSSKASHDIGWIGLGRMGESMAARQVKAGHGLSVWNRTASEADPLAKTGAEVVTDKTAMAHRATVVTMVSPMFAPAGMPPAPVERVNKEVAAVLAAPEVEERLGALGADASPTSSAELGRIVARELKGNAELVKAAGIKIR